MVINYKCITAGNPYQRASHPFGLSFQHTALPHISNTFASINADIVCQEKHCYTVVWERFIVGYFRVRIVCGKIFLSLGVSDKNLLTMNVEVKLFVPLLTNLTHSYT